MGSRTPRQNVGHKTRDNRHITHDALVGGCLQKSSVHTVHRKPCIPLPAPMIVRKVKGKAHVCFACWSTWTSTTQVHLFATTLVGYCPILSSPVGQWLQAEGFPWVCLVEADKGRSTSVQKPCPGWGEQLLACLGGWWFARAPPPCLRGCGCPSPHLWCSSPITGS